MCKNRFQRIQRLFFLCAVTGLAFLLYACVLESDSPVIEEREKPGALNLLAEKVIDISGSYAMVSKNDVEFLNIIRDEKTANAFVATNSKKKDKPVRILVENLPGKNRMLLQMSESSKDSYALFPAELNDDGLTLYPMVFINNMKKMGDKEGTWDGELWKKLLAKQGLEGGREGNKISKGTLSAADYKTKVLAAINGMFEAGALGGGIKMLKEEVHRAAKEKEERTNAFVQSCATATPEQLRKALSDGADPNGRNAGGSTPLMAAAYGNKNAETAKILVEAKAEVNARASDNATPLLLAAAGNPNPEMAAYLLKSGADPKATDKNGHTALMQARKNPNAKAMAQTLLAAGIGIDARDSSGKTAFMLAAEDGNLDFAQTLLEAKADINARDSMGRTALLTALQNRNDAAAEFLLKAGADPNIESNSGGSPFALILGNSDLSKEKDKARVFAMLRAGADINATLPHSGDTLLMREAARARTPDLLVELLAFAPDLRRKNSQGRTVFDAFKSNYLIEDKNTLLQWALPKISDPATVEQLVKGGDDVNARNAKGATALMSAARSGRDIAIVNKLLELGADVNARREDGATALMFAAGSGKADVFDALIKAGSDPLAVTQTGGNALMNASLNGNVEIVGKLLAVGADVNSIDKDGWTPLRNAAVNGNAAAARALLKAGADVKGGPYPAFISAAALTGNTEIFDVLLQAGADPKVTLNDGTTALMNAAIFNKHPSTILYLGKLGADVNAKRKDGLTALMLAAWNNPAPETITALLQCGADAKATAKHEYVEKTALHFAAEKSANPQVIKNLVFGGADINAADAKTHVTPLILASSKNQNPVITGVLLDLGADGRIKGGVYEKETAHRVAHYKLKESPVYMRLNDAQYNKPKELSPELRAECDAYQAKLRAVPAVQVAVPASQTAAPSSSVPAQSAPVPAAPVPAPAPQAAASQPAAPAQTPTPAIPQAVQAAQVPAPAPAAASYPPLVLAANGKPKAAAHRVSVAGGAVELALQVLAPGKTIEAVRIDNVGGVSSLWRSDGRDGGAALTVSAGGKKLADGTKPMAFAPGGAEALLSLSLKDNGAFAGKATEFRVTVFFAGGERALCLLGVK